uniref:hypothetical protein n=1 Tax=Methanobrevibacter sp. TaxID=66852 RepID=UPI003890B313
MISVYLPNKVLIRGSSITSSSSIQFWNCTPCLTGSSGANDVVTAQYPANPPSAPAAADPPITNKQVVTEVYNTIFEKNYVTNHAAVSNNFKDTELKMESCALVGNYIHLNSGKAYGDVALDDNASLLYCWWGQNDIGHYYSPHSSDWDAWKINASRWLIMTFTSNNEIIQQDKNNILTVSLHQYFDNETKEIYDY